MRKWGTALKTGDIDIIQKSFAGHESKRKLTDPIISYAKTRFKELYPENSYDYSKIIRKEIKQHFDVEICAETLRPFLNVKKDELSDSYTEMREYSCDYDAPASSKLSINSNQIPSFLKSDTNEYIHHLGLTLMRPFFYMLVDDHPQREITLQWLSTVMLGAANIEQTQRLDLERLPDFLGFSHHFSRVRASSPKSN